MRAEKRIHMVGPNFKDINPIECGEEKCMPDKEEVSSLRGHYLLHYVHSGGGEYRANNQVYTIGKGQMFIIHPYEQVSYIPNPDDPWHYSWVGFEINFDIPLLQTSYVIENAQVDYLFRALNSTNKTAQSLNLFICSKVFEILSALVQSEATSISVLESIVNHAANYIRINYIYPITIEQIASYLNISRSYFISVFSRHMGVTPYKYLSEIRLTKAAELLTKHRYSVTDAAINSGYNDIYNFSKMFKKKYGASPSVYREGNGNGGL
ncbi:MAG: helix-turn-helix domain-containing protein [Oscillospiraceae bacterium]|nr:helix-turn-helix domain-containing protein [Oscillospiraceae bacterium]